MSLRAAIAWALCSVAAPVVMCVAAGQQEQPQRAVESAGLPAVIVTAAPVYDSLAALRGKERFPQGAQLMVLRAGRMEPLVPALAASADASISFDGKAVVFAAKEHAGDSWQIWEAGVDGAEPHRVMAAATDLARPLWMPGGRMVYARREAAGFALETAKLDGTEAEKLSFLRGNFIPDDVLRDGRVLFESGFPLGAGTTPEIFLVYADGSGVESVRCDHGDAVRAGGREHGRQMLSGDIVFTQGTRLGRFTPALADEEPLAAPAGEYAGDVAELPDGSWLLSVRRPGERHSVLATWKPGEREEAVVARASGRDLVEAVVVAPHAVPNRHPSALHPWTTGNLLALNARLTRGGTLPGAPATVRVETQGEAGHAVVLGTAPVEKDGSFFVQAQGDEPLRFILLDAGGRTLGQERGWFWVRRGEQRICVGCHTGPERAPDNRVPEVLLHSTTPVDVTGGAAPAPAGER